MTMPSRAKPRSIVMVFAASMLLGFAVMIGARIASRPDAASAGNSQASSNSVETSASQDATRARPQSSQVEKPDSGDSIPACCQTVAWLDGGAAKPQAMIHCERRGGMAPLAVHVHGLQSQPGAGDHLSTLYEWDFGDPGSRYNKLEGFNAAHVYDEPGEYTISLIVTNQAGHQDTDRLRVRVERPRRRTIHVSVRGDDRNDGLTPDMPVRSLQRAAELLRDDCIIRFKRGEVFPVRSGVAIARRNWAISTYGEGDAPELQWTGPTGFSPVIAMNGETCEDVLIEGLRFTTNQPDFPERNICDAIVPAGRNITIRDCQFEHVSMAVNCNRRPRELLTIDNRADDLRAYFVWGEGSDHVHLGNLVAGSRFEHNMRFVGVERVLVSDNTLTNEPKRCIWAMAGEFMYIARNTMINGGLAIGPNHAEGPAEARFRWCVATSNTIRKPLAPTPAVQIPAGAGHVLLRNNVIEAGGGTAIDVQGHHERFDRNVLDLRVLNNTAINALKNGRFIRCEPGNRELLVANNLYIAPNLEPGQEQTACMFVLDDDLSGFVGVCGNVWPLPPTTHWVKDARHYVWPYWSNAEGYLREDSWSQIAQVFGDQYANVQVDADARPINAAEAVQSCRRIHGVFHDRHGRSRPVNATWTAGAIELSSAREAE